MDAGDRVLAVGDQSGIAVDLERVDRDMRVDHVDTVAAARDALEEETDCVICQAELPDGNGTELFRITRKDDPSLPFVFVLDEEPTSDVRDAILAGGADFVHLNPADDLSTSFALRIRRLIAGNRTRSADSRRVDRTVERISDGFFAVDGEWRYISVNRAGADMVGLSRRELLGEVIWDVFPDIEDSPFGDALKAGMYERERTSIEEYYPAHDAWYDVTVYPDDAGISIFFRDVTDVRERERALTRSEQRYRALTENLPLGAIFLFDTDLTIQVADGQQLELVAPNAESCHGNHVDDVFGGGILDGAEEIFRETVTGESHSQEIVHEDGVYQVETTPFNGDDEQTYAGLMLIQDITDRARRERVITELHRVGTNLTQCESEQAVFDLTIETASELFDFDQAAIAIESDDSLRIQAMSDELSIDKDTSFSIDEGIAGETYRSGEPVLIDDVEAIESARPQTELRSAMSVPIGDHGVFQAIDEEPRAFDETDLELAELLISHTASTLDLLARERALEKKNNQLEQFASILSHDLRNPLAIVSGRLELLQREYSEDHIEEIEYGVNRIEELIEDLSVLAREGEEIHDPTPVELESVARDSWRAVDTAGATLQCSSELTFLADRTRLAQLLENLFENAVVHGGETVSVRVGTVSENTGFFVADNGPGISSEERETVFEEGYSSRPEGTGLGLAIVKRIADAHGWTVTAQESKTGGTRIEIRGITCP